MLPSSEVPSVRLRTGAGQRSANSSELYDHRSSIFYSRRTAVGHRIILVSLLYLFAPIVAFAQNLERVIIAMPGIGLSQLPAFVAQEKGFYKQERLEALNVVMDGT